MLRTRIITAVVLVLVLLASLAVDSPLPFVVLTLLLIAAAGWEWSRLNQSGAALAVVFGLLLAAACAGTMVSHWMVRVPAAAWWTAAVLWAGGGALALNTGADGWPRLPRAGRWAIGLVALWAAWLAMTHARLLGINLMLSIFCVVWMADVAAYFGGRAFGRRKLAPAISPKKSWEGVWSGMAGVLLLALFWAWLDRTFDFDSPSLFTLLADRIGIAATAGVLLLLAGMSVVGDLVESIVKRAAGAKDSSALLPGHGGVLDRVDALLPVFPIALAFTTLT